MQEKLYISQTKGLSPEWIRMCVLRFPDIEQQQSHCVQLNGVSPVWISMCVLRLLALVKELSHCMQVKYCSPMCLYVRLEVSSLSAGVIALCAVERLSLNVLACVF